MGHPQHGPADAFATRHGIPRAVDECVDSFRDGRTSLGFNYETEAANRDILQGLQQNAIMPWSATLRIQEHMDRIRQQYSQR